MSRALIPVVKVDGERNIIKRYRSASDAARENYMSYQTVLDRCRKKVKNEYDINGHTYRFETGGNANEG